MSSIKYWSTFFCILVTFILHLELSNFWALTPVVCHRTLVFTWCQEHVLPLIQGTQNVVAHCYLDYPLTRFKGRSSCFVGVDNWSRSCWSRIFVVLICPLFLCMLHRHTFILLSLNTIIVYSVLIVYYSYFIWILYVFWKYCCVTKLPFFTRVNVCTVIVFTVLEFVKCLFHFDRYVLTTWRYIHSICNSAFKGLCSILFFLDSLLCHT